MIKYRNYQESAPTKYTSEDELKRREKMIEMLGQSKGKKGLWGNLADAVRGLGAYQGGKSLAKARERNTELSNLDYAQGLARAKGAEATSGLGPLRTEEQFGGEPMYATPEMNKFALANALKESEATTAHERELELQKNKTGNPYYTAVYTPEGVMAFNNRTSALNFPGDNPQPSPQGFDPVESFYQQPDGSGQQGFGAVGTPPPSLSGRGVVRTKDDPATQGEIAGAKEAAKTKAGIETERELGVNSAVAEYDDMLGVIENVLSAENAKGFDATFGAIEGLMPTYFPSTRDAEAQVNQVESFMSLEAREKLKGSGAISDFESRTLASASTLLGDRTIGEKLAREEMEKIRKILNRAREREISYIKNPELREKFKRDNAPEVDSQEKYDALPSGAYFYEDGEMRIKP